jgi:hypothetical protein
MLKLSPFSGVFLLLLSTAAFPQNTTPSEWDHNGSVVSLIAKDSDREFYYKKPRQGLLDSGVREGSLLFRGELNNGRYDGTAYLFDRRCGARPYHVSGTALDNEQRIVLTGEAPRLGRNCRVQGSFEDRLEFKLLKPLETASPPSQPSANPKPSANAQPQSSPQTNPNPSPSSPSSPQIQPSTNPNPSTGGSPLTGSIAPAAQPVPQAPPKSENQKSIEFIGLFWLIPLGVLLAWSILWLKAAKNG